MQHYEAAILKAFTTIVVKYPPALRSRDEAIETAVVVVVDECHRAHGSTAQPIEHRRRASVARKLAAAIVMPEAALATPDEEIQCAVVVVVADRDRTGASDRVGGTREATHRVVEKQTIAADLARDEHVGAPGGVLVAEGGIGSALDGPARRGRLGGGGGG